MKLLLDSFAHKLDNVDYSFFWDISVYSLQQNLFQDIRLFVVNTSKRFVIPYLLSLQTSRDYNKCKF